jgi:hypothetical protein
MRVYSSQSHRLKARLECDMFVSHSSSSYRWYNRQVSKFPCIRSLSGWRSKYFLHGNQALKVVARFAIINQVFLLFFFTGVGVVFDRLGTLLWWRWRCCRVVSSGVWHDGKSGGGSAASCSCRQKRGSETKPESLRGSGGDVRKEQSRED